jgi:hypothetical protein
MGNTPARGDSIAAIAAREGRTPQDVAYDMLIEDDGRGFIFACIVNYANYDLEPVKAMYARQHVIPGLSDGGAHVAFISDASFPTFLFSYWGRDRGADRMDIPDLVRRQTREPARFAGLSDRGLLAPGMKADINVIDFANLALERPQMVVDLPAGGWRLMQEARGYAATIKAGQITYRDGVATGALAGGLVRDCSNTPLSSRFARWRVRPAGDDAKRSAPAPEEWLLIEWPEDAAEPDHYWLSTLPAEISQERMVDQAKLRWRIEGDYLELKQRSALVTMKVAAGAAFTMTQLSALQLMDF